ncbi:hypothetical protein GT003_25875 [Paenibacillus sacheonensis]|uniref:Uncharacterized protein n=2 Tax=Paenibacillus sacheonensis TaxID=742054 RepID=A0A7X4YTS2_9BACL|nr:hypothetical protein [Paenibacillus sacheonensis]NBC72440.1 hypothetical protein [Paenibacillus sacheonensis]
MIVAASLTKAGTQFIKQLLARGVPFAAVTNSIAERQQLSKLGVRTILLVNTIDSDIWAAPGFPVGQSFLFESSLSLCCRYVRMVRAWSGHPVSVITSRTNGRLIYKSLGADRIVHAASGSFAFLTGAE